MNIDEVEQPDPGVPTPPELGADNDGSGAQRLCNFCQFSYSLKRDICPRCGKPYPRMPNG